MSVKRLHLSVVDQTIFRGYVRYLITFPFPDISRADAAIEAVASGLQATINEFPHFAGTIGPVDLATGKLAAQYPVPTPSVISSGIFSTNFELANNTAFRYEDLQAAGMPPSRLPGSLFCPKPLRGHPGLEDEFAVKLIMSPKVEIPIMGTMMSFLPGGVVLSVWIHHVCADGIGQARLCEKWAENVKLRRSGDDELLPIDPSILRLELDAIAQVVTGVPVPKCPEFTTLSAFLFFTPTRSGPVDVKGKIFTVSAKKIAQLCMELSNIVGNKISSFAVLSCLFWAYAVRARGPVLETSKFETSTLGVAMDHRKRLGPPFEEGYDGHLALFTTATSPIAVLLAPDKIEAVHLIPLLKVLMPIGSLSRSWVVDRLKFLFSVANVATVVPYFHVASGPDFFITSWMHIGASIDWDIPGVPWKRWDYFRKPGGSASDGGIIILPRQKSEEEEGLGNDTGYEVMVQLVDEDLERLEKELEEGMWVEKVVE